MTDSNDFLLELDFLEEISSEIRPVGTGDGQKTNFLQNKNVYVVPNPKPEKAQYKPFVIGTPAPAKNKVVTFKGSPFPNTPVHLGTLFEKAFIVMKLLYPSNALYTGTDDTIFPQGEKTVEKEGIQFAAGVPYTIKVPIVKELGTDYYPKSYDVLELDKDTNTVVRKTLAPKTTASVVIPVLTAVVDTITLDPETNEEVVTYTNKVVLFEQSINFIQANELLDKKLITKKSLIEVIGYVFSDLATLKDGDKVVLFENPSIPSTTDKKTGTLCMVPYTGKVPVSEEKFFPDRPDSVPTPDELERIIMLDMMIGGVRKNDITSPLGVVNNYYWEKIKALKEQKKAEGQ